MTLESSVEIHWSLLNISFFSSDTFITSFMLQGVLHKDCVMGS